MLNERDLQTAIGFFTQKDDLSHLDWIKCLETSEDNGDSFLTVGRVLGIDPDIVGSAWIIADSLKTLRESELLDGGDLSEFYKTNISELLEDFLAEQELDLAEENELSITDF